MEHRTILSLIAMALLLIVCQLSIIAGTDYCSCYYFHTVRKRWDESNQYCQQNGGNLVSMETEEEYQFNNKTIQSLDVSDNEWYIGLIRTSGDWKWTSGQSYTLTDKWLPAQPDGDGECVKMIKDYKGLGLFDDIKCSIWYMFICENKTGQTCPKSSHSVIVTKWCSSNDLTTTMKDYLPTTAFWPTTKETRNYCSCYSTHTIRKSWYESNQYCQQNGGNLVSMETEEEYQFVNKTIQSLDVGNNEWHIGLTTKSEDWKWTSGQSYTLTDKWLPGQPYGDGECVKMIKDYRGLGLLGDIKCGIWHMFICEHKTDLPVCNGARLIWCPGTATTRMPTTAAKTEPHSKGCISFIMIMITQYFVLVYTNIGETTGNESFSVTNVGCKIVEKK